MVDFLISVGHTPSGTIGSGAADLLDESNCTREIAPLVVKYLLQLGYSAELLVFNRGNYYKYEDCHVRAKQANNIGGTLFAEIHLNSGTERRGDGCEVCVTGNNPTANTVGQAVSASLSSMLGIDDRGLRNEPGLIVLKETNMTAILIECMFVDGINADTTYNVDKIARAIVAGLTGKNVNTRKAGWIQSSDQRWWYCTDPEKYCFYTSENGWKEINGEWYIFDAEGFALQDTWYKAENDKWYYLDSDCSMISANSKDAPLWRWIKEECYAFDNTGACYCNCVTPDGYTVDKDGAWDETIPKIIK